MRVLVSLSAIDPTHAWSDGWVVSVIEFSKVELSVCISVCAMECGNKCRISECRLKGTRI